MKLPPLTALRHFNAAATHLSFKVAAQALCVSEGAISRQIKLLEDHFGTRLFERLYRGVKLTETGQRLHTVTDSAFHQIADISQEILNIDSHLNLSVTTSFAIRWLMKRLKDFEKEYPHIPINLQAVTDPDRLIGGHFDASILYLLGNPFNKSTPVPPNSDRVMIEWLLPVCAPSMLSKAGPLPQSDIHRARLIFNEPTGRDWRSWIKMLPNAKADLEKALKFEHDDTAIQAAVAGHGIALANLAYISNELEMGSLVPAVQCEPLPIGAHYIVSAPNRRNLPNVKAFRNWILKLAAQDPSQLDPC
ncbi:MAG: LysR family transcriptional regulator [Sneathiella sp.]|nr:LysR family transcriptional regulator [Sneathiella sp.]